METQECPFCNRIVKVEQIIGESTETQKKYKCSYCKKEWFNGILSEKKYKKNNKHK